MATGDLIFLSEDFRSRLEAKISELEKLTSVEFVPALVARATDYPELRLIYALFTVAALLLGLRFASWPIPIFMEGLLAIFGAVAVYLLTGIESILVRVLPPGMKRAAIVDRAEALFLHEEIFATRERTGVLIFISLQERAVFVLADKGLRAKVAEHEWVELGRRLAHDFNRRDPGASFFEALDALAQRLQPDFPPQTDNPNELSDKLRF